MGRRPFVAEKILETAFDCFAREGFEAVSSRALAEAAGVGAASMFRHFPTMEVLGRAVYARALDPWLSEMEAVWSAQMDPQVRLAALVSQLYEGYDHRPRALALLVFPPHTFVPEQVDQANPRSLRARCRDLCRGEADRGALLWGAITGPLQDRFLHQRQGLMAPVSATVITLAGRLLPDPI